MQPPVNDAPKRGPTHRLLLEVPERVLLGELALERGAALLLGVELRGVAVALREERLALGAPRRRLLAQHALLLPQPRQLRLQRLDRALAQAGGKPKRGTVKKVFEIMNKSVCEITSNFGEARSRLYRQLR